MNLLIVDLDNHLPHRSLETLNIEEIGSIVPIKTLCRLSFLIFVQGDKMKYLKCRATYSENFPFETNEIYSKSRIASHLLHINDYYSKYIM